MVIVKRILAVLVALVIAVIVARRCMVGDEHKIRKKLRTLSECISKKPDESAAAFLIKTERLRTLFNSECGVAIPRYNINRTLTPTEIVQRTAQLHRSFDEIHIAFHDISVELIDRTHASVRCTVRASATRTSRDTETAEIISQLEKIDGKWVFTRFEQVPVLE